MFFTCTFITTFTCTFITTYKWWVAINVHVKKNDKCTCKLLLHVHLSLLKKCISHICVGMYTMHIYTTYSVKISSKVCRPLYFESLRFWYWCPCLTNTLKTKNTGWCAFPNFSFSLFYVSLFFMFLSPFFNKKKTDWCAFPNSALILSQC